MDNLTRFINDNRNKSEIWFKKNHTDFHLYIFDKFKIDISWREKLYLHISNLKDVPTCYCGKPVRFKNISSGYFTYCSNSCAKLSPEVKKRTADANLMKWGVDNPMKNIDIKKRYTSVIIEKWGVNNVSKIESLKI